MRKTSFSSGEETLRLPDLTCFSFILLKLRIYLNHVMSKCARYAFSLAITDNLCNGIPHCVSREQNININKTKKASKRRQKRKTLFDQQTKQLSQPSIQPVSQTPIKVSDVSVLNTDRNKTVAYKSRPLGQKTNKEAK